MYDVFTIIMYFEFTAALVDLDNNISQGDLSYELCKFLFEDEQL